MTEHGLKRSKIETVSKRNNGILLAEMAEKAENDLNVCRAAKLP